MKCQHCHSAIVLCKGNERYCAGCFEAGASSCKEMWNDIQKHIEKEAFNGEKY